MKIIKKINWYAVSTALLMLVPSLQAHADSPSYHPVNTSSPVSVAHTNADNIAVTQGDILVRRAAPDLVSPRLLRGMARAVKNDKWVNGLVYYQFDSSLSQAEIDIVNVAIDHWNERSSVTIIERNDNSITDYINFESSSGCASWVGRIGGEQAIWIGPTCDSGSMIHEIGHAVGLFHEHTRADRDNFISVQWNNVIPGKELNFDIYDDNTELIGDYDYGSIMHYGDSFFSKNGNSTITVPDGISIGQRIALSTRDLQAVDQMYQTDLSLTTTITTDDEDIATLDVIVTNQGLMGAHDLEFNLPLTIDAAVLSTSGSDWSCSTDDALLTCTLRTLAEGASSLLAVELASADNLISDEATYLTSKTHDSDLSNNGSVPVVNPDTEAEPDLETALPEVDDKTPPEPEIDVPDEQNPSAPDGEVMAELETGQETNPQTGPQAGPTNPGTLPEPTTPPGTAQTPTPEMQNPDITLGAGLAAAAAGSMSWLSILMMPLWLLRRASICRVQP